MLLESLPIPHLFLAKVVQARPQQVYRSQIPLSDMPSPLFLPQRLEVEMDHNVVANKIVRLSSIYNAKVFSVNSKLAVYRDIRRSDRDRSRKRDRLFDAAHFEITGDRIISLAFGCIRNDLCRNERRRREFIDLKEIAGLQMSGQLVRVSENRFHLDLNFDAAVVSFLADEIDR